MIYFIFIYLFLWLPDVYCYLKDPPPEFLPRFGTITMAGLLGMFLARKGTLIWSSNKMKCEKSLKSLHLPCLKLACIHLCDLMLGSRFKRTVVPLGLMSAAASVCYPAQAVAVVKVIQSLNVSLIRWCSERRMVFWKTLSLSFHPRWQEKRCMLQDSGAVLPCPRSLSQSLRRPSPKILPLHNHRLSSIFLV